MIRKVMENNDLEREAPGDEVIPSLHPLTPEEAMRKALSAQPPDSDQEFKKPVFKEEPDSEESEDKD